MDCRMPGLPVHRPLLEFTQTHVHWVGDAIQPFCPLSSPSPPAFNLSQHQGLFHWVSSSHQVAEVLEFQLQHQSFQWIFRTDFLYDGLVGRPCSPWDSQESSPTPQFKSINSSLPSFLCGPSLTSMYGCESCTVKKAECWRIDAFELWCWRRLLRVPWTTRRSNQSILKEISPEYSLEGNSNTLATLCEELTHLKMSWCWERLKAGGEGDDRGWDGWMASPTQWTWVCVNSGSWWWIGRPVVLQSMGSQKVGHDWETELNWTDTAITTMHWHTI